MTEIAPILDVEPGQERRPAVRVAPFVPRGIMRPLVLLHIPKTSGSSCNRLFAEVYGPDNFIPHAEYRLPVILSRRGPPQQSDGLSAHVPLCRWSLYAGSAAYGRVTMLRDPWARLVSHINWVGRFLGGHPMPRGETAGALARVVAALGRTDFDDRDSLLAFMACVRQEAEGFNSFDNLQTRMLYPGHPRATYRAQIGEREVEMAVTSLRDFALVGFCEDQQRFRDRLLALLGLPARPADPVRENVGSLRLLSPDNALAREVFAPWVALDHQVYDAARAL